jgi:hypothetical protein
MTIIGNVNSWQHLMMSPVAQNLILNFFCKPEYKFHGSQVLKEYLGFTFNLVSINNILKFNLIICKVTIPITELHLFKIESVTGNTIIIIYWI